MAVNAPLLMDFARNTLRLWPRKPAIKSMETCMLQLRFRCPTKTDGSDIWKHSFIANSRFMFCIHRRMLPWPDKRLPDQEQSCDANSPTPGGLKDHALPHSLQPFFRITRHASRSRTGKPGRLPCLGVLSQNLDNFRASLARRRSYRRLAAVR